MDWFLALQGFLVILLVFLVCRELVCWYFKINATLFVLEEIRDALKTQNINAPVKSPNSKKSQTVSESDSVIRIVNSDD